MWVDSHCHLDKLNLSQYNGDLSAALTAARANQVSQMLCVCIDLEHFADVLLIAEQHVDIFASVGVHPTEIIAHEPTVAELIELGQHPKVVAFGETGLDYYRDDSNKAVQQERLRRHIRAARAADKPVIVHTRNAQEDTIQIIREEGAAEVGGVLHCFTESWEMAQRALELNFYISFSGIVTFKNAQALQETVKRIPLDRLLIETDSPYLAPMPHRGKPNQPAYLKYVAEYIAELRGISVAELAAQTTQNFFNLFRHAKA